MNLTNRHSEEGHSMMDKGYITDRELRILIEDLMRKIETGDLTQVKTDLAQVLSDAQSGDRYIDRTYISKIKDQRRLTKIAEITAMLNDMNNEQIDNVHVYVVNEHDEPNHEAVALEAIIKLSKEQRMAEK